jgi:hypothetical protein
MAHVASLGLYTHRETDTPELMAQLDIRRQLDYHERFLREVAYRSARPEIDNDMAKVRESLTFISANGSAAQAKTSRAIAKIFRSTEDDEARTLCLAGLYKINNGSAKNELLAIYRSDDMDGRWRQISAQYLKLAIEEKQHIWARDAKTLAFIGVGSTN